MSEPHTLGERARALRANMTEAERRLWRSLRAHRFRGRAVAAPGDHRSFHRRFRGREVGLVIEVDGGQDAGSSRDLRRDARLASQGYRVLRFWNTDVLRNMAGVLDTIGAAPPPPQPSPMKGEGVAVAPAAGGAREPEA